MNDDFYIGWSDSIPERHRRWLRWTSLSLVTAVAVIAILTALSQQHLTEGDFEWGHPKSFSGILHLEPIPHLQLDSDPANPPGSPTSAVLVSPWKWGAPRELLTPWEGKHIEIQATRIHNDHQWMLECIPESIHASSSTKPTLVSPPLSLGPRRLFGEIVDSKCWVGVMNPGVLKPHKSCAVRCISGGIPPMLVIRRENESPLGVYLIPTPPQPLPTSLLDRVGEPMALDGELSVHNGLVLFRYDPRQLEKTHSAGHVPNRTPNDSVCGLH